MKKRIFLVVSVINTLYTGFIKDSSDFKTNFCKISKTKYSIVAIYLAFRNVTEINFFIKSCSAITTFVCNE